MVEGIRPKKATCGSVAALYKSIVPNSKRIAEPIEDEIRWAQHCVRRPAKAPYDKDGLLITAGKILIPNNAFELKLKAMIEGHCGIARHWGNDIVENIVCGSFSGKDAKQDVLEFTQECLHCITSRTGEKYHAFLRSTARAEPNEVGHMDFLCMGDRDKGDLKYGLELKDNLKAYSWLLPYAHSDSKASTNGLTKWITSLGCMIWLVSDRGPHFTASIIKNIVEDVGINQHLTTAYCPWANGTVERLCKEVLRTGNDLLLEWKLPPSK